MAVLILDAKRIFMVSYNEPGELSAVRAAIPEYGAVMTILREAADWLSARGIQQWYHWYMDVGEQILREGLEHHEVYLFQRDQRTIGTLTIQWSDPDVWGERGVDGLAGYVHAMAVARSATGMRVGERMLEWAVGTMPRAADASRGLTRWRPTHRCAGTTSNAGSVRLRQRCCRATSRRGCSNGNSESLRHPERNEGSLESRAKERAE